MNIIILEKYVKDIESSFLSSKLYVVYKGNVTRFFEKSTTMEDVITEIDMSRGGVYYHTDIFKYGFLVNYINGLIVSSEILGARKSYSKHKKYIKETTDKIFWNFCYWVILFSDHTPCTKIIWSDSHLVGEINPMPLLSLLCSFLVIPELPNDVIFIY